MLSKTSVHITTPLPAPLLPSLFGRRSLIANNVFQNKRKRLPRTFDRPPPTHPTIIVGKLGLEIF